MTTEHATPGPEPSEFAPSGRIAAQLKARIAREGPLPVSVFMIEALFDPLAGFYAAKDPIGAGADFITAPEISQMFGELIGVWAAECWTAMDAPDPVQLIELGPGRGAMMADMLRAARLVPAFSAAAQVTLVEASAALKMVQAKTLAASPNPLGWTDSLDRAPAGPAIIIGNEFLDCLPVRQAIRHEGVWRERCVGLDPDDPDRFAFVLGPVLRPDEAFIPAALRDAPEGALVEMRPGDLQVVDALSRRFSVHPGYALFIDYGPSEPEPGDTLQAIRKHEKVDPLDAPGTADLTARVDFATLGEAAREAGLAVFGPKPQGEFLIGLGVEARAATLIRARPDAKAVIARQLHRLTDEAEMGVLFKAICIASPGLPAPPGLDPSPQPTEQTR